VAEHHSWCSAFYFNSSESFYIKRSAFECLLTQNLSPLEVFLAGANLKMVLYDAEVNLAVADHREDRPGREFGRIAATPEDQML
jgi:hypothetical protein